MTNSYLDFEILAKACIYLGFLMRSTLKTTPEKWFETSLFDRHAARLQRDWCPLSREWTTPAKRPKTAIALHKEEHLISNRSIIQLNLSSKLREFASFFVYTVVILVKLYQRNFIIFTSHTQWNSCIPYALVSLWWVSSLVLAWQHT